MSLIFAFGRMIVNAAIGKLPYSTTCKHFFHLFNVPFIQKNHGKQSVLLGWMTYWQCMATTGWQCKCRQAEKGSLFSQ
jgi:hypothetical protein